MFAPMKVERLIELLEREDADAEVVQRVEHLYRPVTRLIERKLVATQVRNTYTDVLMPGFKEAGDEGKVCVEAQY